MNPAPKSIPGGSAGKRALLGTAALFMMAALSGCVTRYVEGMFFVPDNKTYSQPSDFGLNVQDVHFATADGSMLHGWFIPATTGAPARGTVLHLHGNGANISNWLPLIAWLPARGYNVLTIDYRGYGSSEGKPTLDGVVEDGCAALAYLQQRADIDTRQIALLGQSLGGSTAIRVADRCGPQLRALIVDSAFASYRGIALQTTRDSRTMSSLAPIGVRVLPLAGSDPVTVIERLRMPLMILHGTADQTIPFSDGEALNAAAPRPHTFVALGGGAHIDALSRAPVRDQIDVFLRDAFSAAPKR